MASSAIMRKKVKVAIPTLRPTKPVKHDRKKGITYRDTLTMRPEPMGTGRCKKPKYLNVKATNPSNICEQE